MNKNIYWVFFNIASKIQSNPISTEDAQMAILKMKTTELDRFFIWTEGWQSWQPLNAYLNSQQPYFTLTYSGHPGQLNNDKTIKAKERDVSNSLKTKSVKESKSTEFTQSLSKSFSLIILEDRAPIDPLEQNDAKSFDGDDLNIKQVIKPNIDFSKLNKNKALKNRANRHEFKIEVLLISTKGKTFRSFSRNISLSGALLEDQIPQDFHKGTFDIVIMNHISKDPKMNRINLRGKIVGEGIIQRLQYLDVTPTQKTHLEKLLTHYKEQQELQSKPRKTA